MLRRSRILVALTPFLVPAVLGAQDTMGRRASLFDLGIYAGGAWTSDWFEAPVDKGGDDESFGIGFAPLFGVAATYWTSPTFGIRVNGAYMPSNLPESDDFEFEDEDNWIVNNWLFDVQGLYRPSADDSLSVGPTRRSMYILFGIGTITTNGPDFLGELGDAHTALTGSIGIGADLVRIGNSSALFGELNIRGYKAAIDDFDGAFDKKFAFTVGVNFGVNFGMGEPRR